VWVGALESFLLTQIPMKRSTLAKVLVMVGTVLVAGWLLMDASTTVLYARDPVGGRARGCYTKIEILLGLKSPTDWIRMTELYRRV